MTEESFQQCRKVMQKANHLRGMITRSEGYVKKWTAFEDFHRKELHENQANAAKRNIEKCMITLEKYRRKFAEMKFPESNIIVSKIETVQCEGCGARIAKGNTYCGECLCEDDSDY
jgi:hypothetical protein